MDRAASRPSRRFAVGLALALALALGVRWINVLVWQPTSHDPRTTGYYLGGDAFFYHWQAHALVDGAGYANPALWLYRDHVEPTAGHPPAYSTYLALWTWAGVGSVTGHRLVSGLLGVAAIAGLALLARRLAGERAGLLAAFIGALYPQLWINDGMLLSESLAIAAVAWFLYAVYAFWEAPSTKLAVAMGVTGAIAALTRTELIAVFPLIVVPLVLWRRDRPWQHRLRWLSIAAVAALALVGPWVVRNLTSFNEPVTLTSGAGAALSAASCDQVYYGSLIGYYANCFQGPWPSLDLDESERDLYPRRYAQEYIRDHLERLPVVIPARVGRVWGLFKPGQTTALDWKVEARGRAASWIGLFAFYILVAAAVVGLIALRRRRIPIYPLVAFAAIVTLAVAGTFGVTRYRAPTEVAIVAAAAVGVDATLRRFVGSGD